MTALPSDSDVPRRTPVDALLGVEGEPVQCKVFSPTVAMHWFATDARPGDTCICGERTKTEDE